jgi:CubicO group peptidase (beta-lactamase class C family)
VFQFDALVARARRDVDEGLLPSCQLALAHDGELVLDETFGLPTDTRYVTFSVTKAFVGAVAWLLIGDGAMTAETRVADVVPEFAANGKDAVTVEHLLTHTAGFPLGSSGCRPGGWTGRPGHRPNITRRLPTGRWSRSSTA